MQNSRWSLGWFCLCVPGGCFSYVNERFPSKDVRLDLILHIELHLNSCWNQKKSHLKGVHILCIKSGRNWRHAQAEITFRVCTENKRPNPEVKGRKLASLPPGLGPSSSPRRHRAVKPGSPGSPGARARAYATLAPRAHSWKHS